jgi:hypothetical protein
MFSPLIARAKTKAVAPSTNGLAHRFLSKRDCSPTGKEVGGDNEREAVTENMTARGATRGPSWDFSRIPIHSPDRTNRTDTPLLFSVPRTPIAVQRKLMVGQVNDPLEYEAGRVAPPASTVKADIAFEVEGRRDSTRAPAGGVSEGEEDVTVADAGASLQDAGGSGAPTAPAAPPTPSPAPVRSTCKVASGPTYTPSGTLTPTISGGRKSFPFSMAATFATLAPTAVFPACCEVHQFIKWDARYVASKGGPPHGGFPSSAQADTWIEDRDANDKRYGHRSDSHSDPIEKGGDEYTTGGVRDQVHGDTYAGKDGPSSAASRVGTFQFRLDVVDTCNSNATKASSSIITLPWG